MPNIPSFHVLVHVIINAPQTLVNERVPRLPHGRVPLTHETHLDL